MPNFVYTSAIQTLLALDWETADVRAILLDETSSAGDDADAMTIDDIQTLGEVSGTGYERKPLTEKTATVDWANKLLKYSAAHLSYGGIGVGAIDALLLYLHESDDDDSTPLLYLDNRFRVIAAAPAEIGDETVHVDPIPDRIVSGSELHFPAATIATLIATAEAGARQLQVQPLTGAVALAAEALSPVVDLPVPTNGGPLTIALPDNLLEVAVL